ncbi:alpha/beta hydrolase [uncultured Veillonella sp.]|uniref:alpha/beta hydrolase n=1 Tax=uncultured Veillonella sp. TaxID=159268 RepID=UPI0026082BB8|nr:alpha/beta hydrolase [uncultured Veillonella sp.]
MNRMKKLAILSCLCSAVLTSGALANIVDTETSISAFTINSNHNFSTSSKTNTLATITSMKATFSSPESQSQTMSISQSIKTVPHNQMTNNNTHKQATAVQEVILPTYQDIVFGKVSTKNGEEKDLHFNLYMPKNAEGPVPLLIFVHGGAWAKGTYADPLTAHNPQVKEGTTALSSQVASQNSQTAQTSQNSQVGQTSQTSQTSQAIQNNLMAADNRSSLEVFKQVVPRGIALASVEYRLSDEAAYPAQIYDVKGAIRYLRAHAQEYNIDPNRIAISGTSAGAHLAALAATTNDNPDFEGTVGDNRNVSSKVMAAIDYYGPTDLLTMGPEMSPSLQAPEKAALTHDSPSAKESVLLGFDQEGQGVGVLRHVYETKDTSSPYWSYVELALAGSPINHVSNTTPPFFIAHGGQDTLVPIAQSERFRQALLNHRINNEYVSNSEAPHGYQGDVVNQAMIDWIVKQLLPANA